MIVTKEPQIIDAKNGIEGIVYIRVANQLTVKEGIQFDIELFTLNFKPSTRDKAVLDKDGNMLIDKNGLPKMGKENILVPDLKKLSSEKAVFSAETFYSKIGHLKFEDFDKSFISQMEFLNKKDWNKSDKTPVRYWNLTAKDVSIITDEEFALLLKTKTA